MHVRQGRCCNTSSESRRVVAVLTVENQRDIHRVHRVGLWIITAKHVEQIGRQTEIISGFDGLESLCVSMTRGDRQGHFREQAYRFADIRFVGIVLGLDIAITEGGDGRAQKGHGVSRLWCCIDHLHYWVWQVPLNGQRVAEGSQLSRIGQIIV